jgi:hypothetical protein
MPRNRFHALSDEEEDYPVEIEPDLHRAFARARL